jgi:hypothetical protein
MQVLTLVAIVLSPAFVQDAEKTPIVLPLEGLTGQ